MPENQTAWISDNQELKKKSTGTTRRVRQWATRASSEKPPEAVDQVDGAGCREVAGCAGGADLRGN